jgi:hypothetical protein
MSANWWNTVTPLRRVPVARGENDSTKACPGDAAHGGAPGAMG